MLIGLVGKSGVGKTAILREIEKLGYKRVVTDTTRPPREGEENGVDYFFESDAEFDEMLNEGEFIETTSYNVATGETWRYGTTRGQLAEVGDKGVIILNPDGLKAFREKGINIQIVLIESNEAVVLKRLIARGDTKEEIERRMEADDRDFEGISEIVDFSVYNESDSKLDEIAKMIVNLAETSRYD